MDPRDVATMILIAGPSVALGSALLVVGLVRIIGRRRGNMVGKTPHRKDR